jgi:hypothetical protein
MSSKQITLLLTVGCLFSSPCTAQSTGQQPHDSLRNHVFKLKIYLKGEPDPIEQTGFKLKNAPGLITALHGLTWPDIKDINRLSFKLVRYTRNGTGRELKSVFDGESLAFTQFDAENDLAFIQCSDADFLKLSGLSLSQSANLKMQDPILVVGFPESKDLDLTPSYLKGPALDTLKGMINPELYNLLKPRNSPNPHKNVIKMMPFSASSGISGGPVLDNKGQVIGVADGGFFNRSGDKVSTWAIPINSSWQATMIKPDQTFYRIASDKGSAHLFSSKAKPPLDLPLRTIGWTLSRPFILNAAKFDIDWDFTKLNAAFDAYWERRFKVFGERNFFGFYLSSRFLQYRIVREFAHGLPLQGEANLQDGPTVDKGGIQISRIMSWGKLHNSYVGLGGFGLPKKPLLTNYRVFAGYRHYLTPRRQWGVELRAALLMYNVEEVRWHPRLGLARPTKIIVPQNQAYLCAGLTYSIYPSE